MKIEDLTTGADLQALRLALGLNQTEVAEYLGINQQAVSRREGNVKVNRNIALQYQELVARLNRLDRSRSRSQIPAR